MFKFIYLVTLLNSEISFMHFCELHGRQCALLGTGTILCVMFREKLRKNHVVIRVYFLQASYQLKFIWDGLLKLLFCAHLVIYTICLLPQFIWQLKSTISNRAVTSFYCEQNKTSHGLWPSIWTIA